MKRLINLFVLAVFGMSLTYGSSGLCETEVKYTWKIATLAPDGVGWAVYVKNELFQELAKRTHGDFQIDVYWGGTMGDDEDCISKIRIGQLDGAGLSGGSVLMVCPEMSVLTLPYLFNDYDEVDFIRSKMRDKFSKLCEKNGYKMLIWGDQDFDQMYSTKVEIRTVEDFRKCKTLSLSGSIEIAIFQAFGASPIPISIPDTVPNVRSDVGDLVIAPSIIWVGTQLYTVTKYVIPAKIRYMPVLVAVKLESWNQLPENYRTEIDQVIIKEKKEIEFNQFVRKTNTQCYDAMIKYGVKEIQLPESEISKMKDLTRPIWDKLAGKEFPRETLDEILSLLAKYRSSK
ncbi:MAG: TRAP transporter substrate-binding protein DctP [Proteobacteria bacterium]|nr:TRAP transporter substrate-binding protein DctP [Pseudomonadota bacterium]